jgi:hypothetical protein
VQSTKLWHSTLAGRHSGLPPRWSRPETLKYVSVLQHSYTKSLTCVGWWYPPRCSSTTATVTIIADVTQQAEYQRHHTHRHRQHVNDSMSLSAQRALRSSSTWQVHLLRFGVPGAKQIAPSRCGTLSSCAMPSCLSQANVSISTNSLSC